MIHVSYCCFVIPLHTNTHTITVTRAQRIVRIRDVIVASMCAQTAEKYAERAQQLYRDCTVLLLQQREKKE
jgi:hypothetical protein